MGGSNSYKGTQNTSEESSDLWAAATNNLRDSPVGFLRITWVKAHALDAQANQKQKKPEYAFTEQELERNQEADKWAKAGAAMHNANTNAYDLAEARAFLCAGAQRMYVENHGTHTRRGP